MSLKLISWNVNGIRAIVKKNFYEFLKDHEPDVLGLQEVKAQREQVHLEVPGYEIYWNAAKKPGYSGTALLTKIKPQDVTYGIGHEDHDNEGRVITAEFPEYFLVNVYVPNAGEELKRLPYRMQWDEAFRTYLKGLEKKKPVIVCGDLNVAHTEIDLANPGPNRGSSGFTDEERANFTKFLESGFTDSFRHFYPDLTKQYTWWTYRFGARSRNVGWRIDYFCFSKDFAAATKDAFIRPEVLGSDHCPVGLVLK
ncbi:MAG: exodeoxyribonuclease III [Deltaproteobacteria bacterium]|nr:MAG: exodeoxyribonuclease III [Deltaproteobacteria bacterium]